MYEHMKGWVDLFREIYVDLSWICVDITSLFAKLMSSPRQKNLKILSDKPSLESNTMHVHCLSDDFYSGS